MTSPSLRRLQVILVAGLLAGVSAFGPLSVQAQSGGPTACRDGNDNDNDGVSDGDDPGCRSKDDKRETVGNGPACDNNKDDDGDGKVDTGGGKNGLSQPDAGCTGPTDGDETNPPPPPVTACNDGLDNDGDGKKDSATDGTGDSGCENALDNDESSDPVSGHGSGIPMRACSNGIDDDHDGIVDFAGSDGESEEVTYGDPGCTGPEDEDETNPDGPACDNGLDDDEDGLIDFHVDGTGDPDCFGPTDPSEFGQQQEL